MNYNGIDGINLVAAKRDIEFPVSKELVFTQQNDRVQKNAITRDTPDGTKILGLISTKRDIIPYSDMMDWVVGEFNHLNLDFKLKENSIIGNSDDLYQQYLFDLDVATPDNQNVSAMLIMRGSHVGTPLKIDMGTYRFVCSNGVTVGTTFNTISLKARDLNTLLTHNLRDQIADGMDAMTRVAARYVELGNEDMTQYLVDMMKSDKVATAFKKSMIEYLAADGTIEMLTESKLKNADFLTSGYSDGMFISDEKELFSIKNQVSAWTLYNNATNIATHQTKNEMARTIYYNTVSNIFAA